MQNQEPKLGFWQAVCSIIKLISDFLKQRKDDKKAKEIANVKKQLQFALAEGRISDASYWNQKLAQLSAAILFAVFIGCITPQPVIPQSVIIGERVNKVNPGDTIKIPPLAPPSKQWYLVDDHGLYQWLDINLTGAKAIIPSLSITNSPTNRN